MDQSNQIPPMTQESKKSSGPVIGIVIIVIVLIIGALYFYKAQKQEVPVNAEPLSSSDSAEDISADLSATVINGIDTDLNSVESQLEQ